jgi:arabinose-5-phosphate isomerase
LHVEDVMRTGEQLPSVGPDTSLRDGLLEISRKGLGMTAIVDGQQRVLGIYTDGDLRRALDHPIDLKATRMRDLMTPNPKTISPRVLAAEAVHMMQEHRITQLLVVDERNVLVGALNVHDLFRAGVM